MTKNDMSEFQENAQQSYEEFMRQQEADPLAQQSDAIDLPPKLIQNIS